MLATFLICACVAFFPKMYWFTFDGSAYELNGTIDFLGHDVDVYLTPESDNKWPTLRQRQLVSKMESLAPSFWSKIQDVAVENLHTLEGEIGDMTDEYGLPEINRENIDDFFAVDWIWIPKQMDSKDDYVGLGFSSDWASNSGMYMLLKNGKIIWHGWSFQQWSSQSGREQMNSSHSYGTKLE